MRLQTEIGHLEELLVAAIELLITLLNDSPCTYNPETQIQVIANVGSADDKVKQCTPPCCNCPRPNDFRSTHAVLDFFFKNGYLKTSYWGARGDGRARDLVDIGCGFPRDVINTPTLIPSCSSSSTIDEVDSGSVDSVCVCHEVELNILQRMLIKFKISSDYIAYVCRAEVDEVDYEEQDVP